MQEIKMLVRQVGVPNAEMDIISADDLNEYIAYQLTSQGYRLHSTHYLGEVKDNSSVTVGYKVMLWFVKDDEVKSARVK